MVGWGFHWGRSKEQVPFQITAGWPKAQKERAQDVLGELGGKAVKLSRGWSWACGGARRLQGGKVIFNSLVMGRLWCSMNQKRLTGSREPSEEALVRSQTRDFLVVQAANPPSAGDRGLIPGVGTELPHAGGQVLLCATTRESPHATHTHTHTTSERGDLNWVRQREGLHISIRESLDLETDTTWRKERGEGGVRGFAGRFQPGFGECGTTDRNKKAGRRDVFFGKKIQVRCAELQVGCATECWGRKPRDGATLVSAQGTQIHPGSPWPCTELNPAPCLCLSSCVSQGKHWLE